MTYSSFRMRIPMRSRRRLPWAIGLLIVGGAVTYASITFWAKHSTIKLTGPEPLLLWVFEAPQPGFVVATPCFTDDAIYVAAAHTNGIRNHGAVYAIDPAAGKSKWKFDSNGSMLPTASSPLLAGVRLFVGEGMHADFFCKLHCLNSASGQKHWSSIANSHIEGRPAEANGTVVPSRRSGGPLVSKLLMVTNSGGTSLLENTTSRRCLQRPSYLEIGRTSPPRFGPAAQASFRYSALRIRLLK